MTTEPKVFDPVDHIETIEDLRFFVIACADVWGVEHVYWPFIEAEIDHFKRAAARLREKEEK